MLKIGELAKICNVSAQTLRFYDAEGILCADRVDPSSGYRYYRPEKINDYGRLVMLKEMGFSLDEIKILLNSRAEDNSGIYIRKINELTEQIEELKWNIGKLRKMCDAKDDVFCLRDYDFMRRKFENDPAVIGKWKLVGEVSCDGSFEASAIKCHAHETLYFLPGGEFYWCFYWSRGVLYHMYANLNVVLPNNYRIAERDGEKYMFLEWMCSKFTSDYEEPAVLLYKQEDNIAYTEKQTRKGCDDVFLPYVPDEGVIGVWDVYDYIKDIDRFSPDKKEWNGRLHV